MPVPLKANLNLSEDYLNIKEFSVKKYIKDHKVKKNSKTLTVRRSSRKRQEQETNEHSLAQLTSM